MDSGVAVLRVALGVLSCSVYWILSNRICRDERVWVCLCITRSDGLFHLTNWKRIELMLLINVVI